MPELIETKPILLPEGSDGVCLEFEFPVGMITDTRNHVWIRHDDFHWSTETVIPGVTFVTITRATVH